MKNARSVLITRPQPAAAEFAARLETEGFKTYVAPMSEYIGVSADLAVLDKCQGIVFTSAQAAQIFAAKREAGRALPVFAVGDATAAVAAAAGFTQIYSASGSGADLSRLIGTEAGRLRLRTLLHPCSADTPDDISAALAGTDVEVVRRPVYVARPVSDMPKDVVQAMTEGKVDTVMLFSAKTAENFMRVLGEKGLREAAAQIEALCVSDAVAAALRGGGFKAVRVSAQPTAESVVALLAEVGGPRQERRERPERRAADRRSAAPQRDAQGRIVAASYAGPDRRTGNRRMHERRRAGAVRREKLRFISRSVLTAAFMFIAVVLFGVFLMAPEYFRLSRTTLPAAAASSSNGFFSALIARLVPGSSVSALGGVLQKAMALSGHPQGARAVSDAVARLRTVLAQHAGGDISGAVAQAAAQDPALGALLGGVSGSDLAAGAMLLVLNEFRSNVAGSRPYAADLAVLRRFAGNDKQMLAAINKLAPYAESGLLNRGALQAELQGLAGDIVTAQVKGQDISVQNAARERLDRLSRAASAGEVQGRDPDAVVARAQILLDKGDVQGAMRELQALDGASARAAQPFMNSAGGYLAATGASGDLTSALMSSINQSGGGGTIVNMIKKIFGGGGGVSYLSPSLSKGNGGAGVIAP